MPSPRPRRTLRFTVIVALAAVGTALAAVGGWRYARASAPINGPIILISIDTLRADHLPTYGYTKVKTPAIDALAADGVVFERAYSHAPQTLPAHASLLSGRLPFETGVRDNAGFTIKPGERLLPQLLRERGYTTGGVVSAYVLRKETGIARGFDFFDAEMPEGTADFPLTQVQRDGGESEAVAEHWLDSKRSGRAFLFLHLYEPHKPYAPPARYRAYAPYDGEIAYADEIVGRLVTYLKANQLYDRSTIVLLSDHGEGLGDHGEQEHGLFVYDEAIRVPLIIKQPGGAGAGRRVADPVQHIDLVPTLLDFVKAPVPGNLRGRSLKRILEEPGPLPERPIYSEALYGRYHFGWSELTALTDRRYRYINAPAEELFDLDVDPHERTNVAASHAKARLALRGALDRLVAGAQFQKPSRVAPEDRERLQALGYVGSQADTPTVPDDVLPDPKDKVQVVEAYREAVDLAGQRKWSPAIARLQGILAAEPGMADVWDELARLAARADRSALALDAYKHLVVLRSTDPGVYLGAAAVLLRTSKLEEARLQAELAVDIAAESDAGTRADAHLLLARLALARRDADAAREEARLAEQADPKRPVAAFVDGRLLFEAGDWAGALAAFEQAIAAAGSAPARQIPDLRHYTADTLLRLGRTTDAESRFVDEVGYFPWNVKARAALASLYHATDREELAEVMVEQMLEAIPTAEAYTSAARLWTSFGDARHATAARTEARRLTAEAAPSRARARR